MAGSSLGIDPGISTAVLSWWSAEHSQQDFPAFPWSFPCLSLNGGFSPERDLTAVKSWSGNRWPDFVSGHWDFPCCQEVSEVIALKSLEKMSGRQKEAFSMENSALPLLLQGGIPNGSMKDKEVDF